MKFWQRAAQRLVNAGRKALGFPPWSAAGPWPSVVISGFSGGYGAMQLSTVYGCVRVRGQTMGSLPCYVYRVDKDGQKTKAPDHWLWPIVTGSPNNFQSAFEFFECMERSFCLYGNAYAYKARLGKQVVALQYLNPDAMSIRWDLTRGGLIYAYSWMGKYQEYSPDEILHVKNFSSNGLWGDSPIRSYAINHGMEAQEYSRYFLRNLGRPSGYLKMPHKRPANEEAAARMRDDWQAVHGGPENAGKTGVLWDGGEYVTVQMSNDEAQFIETRKMSVEEIAGGIFGVPLNLIGQSDKTATYASAEQFDLSYSKHTVSPQCRRYEAAIKRSLLAAEAGVVVEFDIEQLVRGDIVAMTQAAAQMAQNGLASRNELRPKFNLPPRPGADDLTVQVNLTPIDKLGEATVPPAQPEAQPPQPEKPGLQPPNKPNGAAKLPLAGGSA